MFSKFEKFVDKIEADKTPLIYWFLALLAVIFIRNFMEGVLEAEHEILDSQFFFFGYVIAYSLLILSILIILKLVTKQNTTKLFKVLTILFLLILIVPPLDYMATRGEGFSIKYIRGDSQDVLNNFFTLYHEAGSPGQRIEGVLFEAFLFVYVFLKTRSYLKSIISILMAYVILILWAAAPTILFMLANPGIEITGDVIAEYVPSSIITLCMLLLITLFLPLLLYISDKKKYSFIKSIIRPLRSLHYMLLAIFGLLLGVSTAGALTYELHNWVFSLAFIVSTSLFYLFACAFNDIFDKDIHLRISGKLESDSQNLNFFAATYFLLAILFAFFLGTEVLVLLVTFSSLAYLYSAPPFRLKKYPLLASFTLAMCALLIILGGFAVFAKGKTVEIFPIEVSTMILVVYTLGTNYKDLKDIKIDKKYNVYTLPVLFGEEKGRIITAFLVLLAFLLVPFILGINDLLLPAIFAALISDFLILKNFNEVYFRLVHIVYFIIVVYFILV